MNKKIFIMVILVMAVLSGFLFSQAKPEQQSDFLNMGSQSSQPANITLRTQADNIKGLWIIHVVETNLNLTMDFNTFILGIEEQFIGGLTSDLESGFSGTCTVTGSMITIVGSGMLGTFSGDVNSTNTYMSGNWVYSDGSPGGTWVGTRNEAPMSSGFDIRGNWLICFEYDNEEESDISIFIWVASISGSQTTGTFKFWDLFFGWLEITSPPGVYEVVGDQVTVTFTEDGGSIVWTLAGKIVNGNMLNGINGLSYAVQGKPTYSSSWAGILYAVPGNYPPFGSFDTPEDGATVYGSIAVTGWTLANRGIESVKIYREEGATLVYVGDAVFIDGARPDVAAAYPNYAYSGRAGWGYMLLTNFFPDGGNGTYKLYAIATDLVVNTTTLGTKTIYCDNAHAVKPFGAIDTPAQGAIISGSDYVNWGWVLTPQPNYIETNGSTIKVVVDGQEIGHPTYNIYRSDIAELFPGYANSNGAVGFFYLDTTAFSNGLHTIQWNVTDSAGNADGIGSRFFNTSNLTGFDSSDHLPLGILAKKITPARSEENNSVSNRLEQYLKLENPFSKEQAANEVTGPITASLSNPVYKATYQELTPVQIFLGDDIAKVEGYQLIDHRLTSLPVGTSLDAAAGKFYWSPGPGFLGKYDFVFKMTTIDGRQREKFVELTLEPKFKVKR